MTATTLGFIFIIVLLVLFLLFKMPVGFAMALSGAMGIYAIGGVKPLVNLISALPYTMSSTYVYTVIPMFVLMGWFVAESGITTDLFIVANKWLGWVRGGLAMAVAVAGAAMGAVCGCSITCAVTLTSIAYPEMKKHNYKDTLSTGILAASGNLGFLIPPSIAFVIYGVMTEESIGHLFMAGILPGILMAILFIAAVYIICRIDPKAGPATPRVSLREALKMPAGGWITILLIIVVLGGLYGGLCTPTEAGALGAFVAFIFGIASRRLTWKRFVSALINTINTSGMVFMMVIGATIFSCMIALSTLPFKLVDIIAGLGISGFMFLIILLVLFAILGFFLDIMSILLILVPVVAPILKAFGIDLIWVGVLVVITVLMGQLSPPFGIVVFAVGGMLKDEVPMWTVFKGAMPFFFAMIVTLILCLFFPEISLIIPQMMTPGG